MVITKLGAIFRIRARYNKMEKKSCLTEQQSVCRTSDFVGIVEDFGKCIISISTLCPSFLHFVIIISFRTIISFSMHMYCMWQYHAQQLLYNTLA